VRKVDEGIENEFIGLVNYAVMGLIQMKLPTDTGLELTEAEALTYYDKRIAEIKALMMAKNHDYGEAWRDMRVSSFTRSDIDEITPHQADRG
jgi:hypothetical protein